MKRKPLKYEEQRWLVQFHTHQDHFQDMMYHPHYVSLPEAATATPSVMEDPAKTEEEGSLTDTQKEGAGQTGSATATAVPNPNAPSASTAGVGVASQPPVGTSVNPPQGAGTMRMPPSSAMPTQASQQGQFTINPAMANRPTMNQAMMMGAGRGMSRPMVTAGGVPINRMMPPGALAAARPEYRMRLEQIRAANLHQQHIRSSGGVQYQTGPGGGVMIGNAPPNYHPSPVNPMNPASVGHDASQLNMQQQLMFQRHQQMQHRRMMAVRLQQQQLQRQRAMMHAHAAAGYSQPQQQQPYAIRPAPMQANPPMPMQQVMQQPQYVQQPGGMMMRAPRPPGQAMAYQPGMNPTMPQQPPMYR